jgi:hypothetical protein
MRTSTQIKLLLGILIALCFGGFILSAALRVAAVAMKSVLLLVILLVAVSWMLAKRK